MEQTRRDTVIELLCAGHRPAAIIKLLKGPSRPIRGRHVHPRKKAWVHLSSSPGWTLSLWGHQQDSAPIHKAKLLQSWLKKNVPSFWDFNIWPPQQPRPEPMRLLLVGEVGEGGVRHTPQQLAFLKASIKSEINKLDPAEVSTDCERFRRRLEDILEAEGGQIE
ncbi:Transposable element tcb2 transposase [Caligus rogercresseyi]|uniref:Transposable element tcb2 transposase n=1 Tax=Caligus rogercresseyi TaxID=217165 RepID=A0A7T8KC94_CALRO|nr:Transposable element tcb2 transposase [Caligus rogercresseyi]